MAAWISVGRARMEGGGRDDGPSEVIVEMGVVSSQRVVGGYTCCAYSC